MKAARCISCGCTDSSACLTTRGPCTWILVDRRRGEGLCSGCATLQQLVFAVLAGGLNTVDELAFTLARSPASVRSALGALEERELVRRVRSRGGALWSRTEAR